MPTFGQRPDDVVQDSRGNAISGLTLSLYATEEDAVAGGTPLDTVTTDETGRWRYTTDSESVWVRLPGGTVWRSDSIDAAVAAAEAAQLAAESAATAASDAAGLVGQPADTTVASLMSSPTTETHLALETALEDAIASDPTVIAAASAAVGDAIYITIPSPNLYNPADADVVAGQVLNSTGGLVVSANYTTTGFIPVTAGATYTFSHPRYICFYNSSKVFVGGSRIDNSAQTTVTTAAPATSAYARTSFTTATYGPTFQVEAGSSATTYMAYGTSRMDVDPAFATAVGEAIGAITAADAPAVTLTRTGTAITMASALGSGTLTMNANLAGSNNGAFNIDGTSLGASSVAPGTDEVCPIRTQMSTIGANHGYNCVATFANPDSKDSTDLGSVWTDGSREYVILGFSGGLPVVGGSWSTDVNGATTSAAVAPTVNLTHVSGATHTAAMDYTTKAATQLFPSLGGIKVSLWVDGKEITGDGTAHGAEVVVRETYDILDYGSIYNTAKANVGVSYTTLSVTPAVRFNNTFRYTGSGHLRVSTVMTELMPTTLGSCGGIQAMSSAKSGATLTRYLPGVGSVGGFDWTAGVDMTSYASTTLIAPAHLLSATQAPHFALDVLSTAGTVDCAFALGYLPAGVRGDEASRNTQRLTHAGTTLWDMRSTKKMYPYFTNSEAAGWGTLRFEGFRVFLSTAQVASVLASKGSAVSAWSALSAVTDLPA